MEGDVMLPKTDHHRERENKNKKHRHTPPRPPTTMWSALKRSLQCRPTLSEVHDPKAKEGLEQQQLTTIAATTTTRSRGRCRSGCSRSISNLRDVIHGSKRHLERPPNCSPRSIGSSEFLNPLTHEVILSSSTCELKITGTAGDGGGNLHHQHNLQSASSLRGSSNMSIPRRSPGGSNRGLGVQRASSRSMASGGFLDADGGVGIGVGCHKCGEQFGKLEDVEEHHVANHSVTELVEGDSSRKIVEIICKASWIKTETNITRIERVLKVHNTQKMLARFEEHREMVKLKASKLPKKHPRCLADGNELLRFHGATLVCNLGMNGTSNLCTSEKCSACRIIRNGFSIPKDPKNAVGVFTASTSGRALESIKVPEEDPSVRKALLVCRVVAGRVHKPLENFQEIEGETGFDSLAGKVGLYANIEELYLLNPRALLPCFVVACKP